MKNKNIVVWFSCGAASAVAGKKTIEKYGKENNIFLVNNPVDEEHEDNRRFLKDVEKWLSTKIIIQKNEKYGTTSAVDVWNKERYMSGTKGAPCTRALKKQARYEFELKLDIDFHVLGFTSEETDRHDRFVNFERSNVLPVLIEEKITKENCFTIINEAGILLPKPYYLGYTNANCIGCVKATSPTYWNHVRKVNPDVFKKRAEQSREIGAKLVRVKGKRIFLDELSPDAKGYKMKSYECGIFCNTN